MNYIQEKMEIIRENLSLVEQGIPCVYQRKRQYIDLDPETLGSKSINWLAETIFIPKDLVPEIKSADEAQLKGRGTYWYIDTNSGPAVKKVIDRDNDVDRYRKGLGVTFDTEKEAKIALAQFNLWKVQNSD